MTQSFVSEALMSDCTLLTRASASKTMVVSAFNKKDDIKAGLQKVNLWKGDVKGVSAVESGKQNVMYVPP